MVKLFLPPVRIGDEDGQDVMEYTLLLGFVALAAAAVFPVVTDSMKQIWNVASNHLSNVAKAAA